MKECGGGIATRRDGGCIATRFILALQSRTGRWEVEEEEGEEGFHADTSQGVGR